MNSENVRFFWEGTPGYPLFSPYYKTIVDFEFLSSPDESFPKDIQCYNVRILGQYRIININSCDNEKLFFNDLMSEHRQKKCLEFLMHFLKIYNFELGFFAFNRCVEREKKIKSFRLQLQRRNKDRELKFRISEMHFKEGKDLSEISKEVGMTKARAKKIIWSLRYNQSSLRKMILNDQPDPDQVLLNNHELIWKKFNDIAFASKSVKWQFEYFLEKVPGFQSVSLAKYRKFIKSVLGVKYRTFKRVHPTSDSAKLKDSRSLVSFVMLELLRKDIELIFYDTSMLAESSFKKYAWTHDHTRTFNAKLRNVWGVSHLMMCTSRHRILNFWITRKINTDTFVSFLYETVNYVRNQMDPNKKQIVIVMDNARMHLTSTAKLFCQKMKVYFLLNPPHSSKMNQIEYVFELVKRSLRLLPWKTERKNLHKILNKQMEKVMELNLSRQTWKYFWEVSKALQKRNMWRN